MVSLKIRCGDDIRRISVEKDITFRDLVVQLRQIFRVEQSEELVVKYVDDEGDKVTLSSDVEFKEALQCCKEPIQLVVFKYAGGTVVAPQPVLDNLDLSLSQLLHVEQNKAANEEKKVEEVKKRAEEEARKQEEEVRRIMEQRKREEEERRKKEEEELRMREEERRKREEERKRKEEEELRLREEKRFKEDEERKKREEERRKREEERRRREEEELRMREEERRKKEEERKQREQEEQRREEEEKKKREQEEEQRRKEEEQKRKQEEEQRRKEEELRKKKEEEERKIRENFKPKPVVSKVEAAWVEYKARNGRTVLLDLSSAASARFGVRTYQRVKTPAGAGTVIGVDQEHGFLWFQLDKDMKEGVSYWDDIHDYNSMICKGITPTEETALQHSIPLPKASEAMINTIQNPSEREMMLRAIQQSLIDQQQQEIKNYYASMEASKNEQ